MAAQLTADELSGSVGAALVNDARHDVLAGTGLAQQQHGRRGGCHLVQPELQVLERVAVAEEPRLRQCCARRRGRGLEISDFAHGPTSGSSLV